MARVVERFILLNDACTGLMTRVHWLISFKRPAVLDSSLDKICQKFTKRFPEFQLNAIEKGPSLNFFKQHAAEVHDSLNSYYYTLVDMVQVVDDSQKLLNDVARDVLDLTFDVSRNLTAWFMELLTSIAQLLILVDNLDDRKEFVIIFAYAYYFTQSSYESNYQKLSKFLVNFTNPVRQLQEDCEQISHRVIHTLCAMGPRFVENCQTHALRDKNYLNLCNSPERLAKPASPEVYFELQYLPRIRLWVLYGFLLCPSALEKDETRDMIRLALQFGMVAPVFRDITVNIHDLYQNLFVSPTFKKLKLSKSKEIVKAAHTFAVNESVKEHAESRRFLRATTSMFSSILGEVPGLLAPKLPVVLATIALCRQEVMWYFSHLEMRHHSVKDWKSSSSEEGLEDEYIGELLHLIDQLSSLATRESQIIKNYYLLSFKHGMEILTTLLDELQKSTRMSNFFCALAQALTDFHIDDAVGESYAPDNSMNSFLMNCYRLSSHLMSAQAGSRTPATKALLVHLSNLIFRFECISELPKLLRNFGSLSELYYYRSHMKQALTQNLNSRGHISRYCFSFVTMFSGTRENLHRFCPEETALVAADSVRLGGENIVEICNHIITAFRSLYLDMLQISSMGGALTGRTSKQDSHTLFLTVKRLEISRQIFANISTAIRNHQAIQIFNQELRPGQYLNNSLRIALKEIFRSALSPGGHVERPTKFRFNCKLIFRAIQEIQNHLDIGIESLLQDVLYEEFNDFGQDIVPDIPGQVVNKVTKTSSSVEDTSCASTFVRFFSQSFIRWVALGQVVYSQSVGTFVPIAKCVSFKGRRSPSPNSASSVFSHDYLDLNELQAFCSFAGPHGIRVLESRLLRHVQSSCLEIKRCLADNSNVLTAVSQRLAQPVAWLEAVRKLTGLDELFRNALLVGSILKLRQLLFQALRHTMQSKLGFLSSVISQMNTFQNRAHDPSSPPNRSSKISLLHHELSGDVDGPIDLKLQEALAPLKQTQEDEAIWNLIPVLFGLHFVSASWAHSVFDVSLGALSNNGHCVAECVRWISNATQAIGLQGELNLMSLQDIKRRQKEQLMQFIQSSSYTVFHMNQRESSFPTHHLPSIRLFLNYFVASTPPLNLSALEDSFPYCLLRSDSRQLIEAQIYAHMSADDEKDEE